VRKLSHLTPRYVYYRLLDIWHQKRHPDHPWLTPQAIKILQSWLRPTDKGIEWGSGRSTIWFGRRVAHLLSIEHDTVWYEKTSIALSKNSLLDKIDYRLLPLADKYPPPK